MIRRWCIAAHLCVVALSPLGAQRPRWKVLGDTAGAPSGCSGAAAVAVIDGWFSAFHSADSISLARVTPRRRHFGVFSTGKFTTADTFVRIESLRELVRYARARARRHERMTLEAVRFFGWTDGRRLGFMPYFVRSADDLGHAPRLGIGKAGYRCGDGIETLNLAPRPAFVARPDR